MTDGRRREGENVKVKKAAEEDGSEKKSNCSRRRGSLVCSSKSEGWLRCCGGSRPDRIKERANSFGARAVDGLGASSSFVGLSSATSTASVAYPISKRLKRGQSHVLSILSRV